MPRGPLREVLGAVRDLKTSQIAPAVYGDTAARQQMTFMPTLTIHVGTQPCVSKPALGLAPSFGTESRLTGVWLLCADAEMQQKEYAGDEKDASSNELRDRPQRTAPVVKFFLKVVRWSKVWIPKRKGECG